MSEELTTAKVPYSPKNPRKPHSAKRKHKNFAKNYLKCKGNAAMAYKMTYPGVTDGTAKVNAFKLLRKEEVQNNIATILEDQGMPRDYFVMKMKELAEAKDKNGIPVHAVQWDVVKTGLNFHGIKMQTETITPQIQVNYNLDADKLGGVLVKLSEVTKKLDLSNINKERAENAEIIEGLSSESASQEDTRSEGSGVVPPEQG